MRELLSDEQIEEIAHAAREVLHAHRQEFPAESFRHLIAGGGCRKALLGAFRALAEADTGLITRTVQVRRPRRGRPALALPGWETHMSEQALAAFALRKNTLATVQLFLPKQDATTQAQLEAEYLFRRLRPADPWELRAVLAAEPSFADEHGCATVTRNETGAYHCAFVRLSGARSIFVAPTKHKHPRLLFAGVPLE